MSQNDFAEDPISCSGPVRPFVDAALRRGGWSKAREGVRPLLPELGEALSAVLAGWHQGADGGDVDWELVGAALAGPPTPRHFDEQHQLCVLFCRVAGIGESGRAFLRAAQDAGLSPERSADQVLRELATSIRGIAHKHLGAIGIWGKAGLLFERIAKWPFVADAEVLNWKGDSFRGDLQRYRDLTALDLCEVDDERAEATWDQSRSLGQPQSLSTWCIVFGLSIFSEWFGGRVRRAPMVNRRDEVLTAAKKGRTALQAWMDRGDRESGTCSTPEAELQDKAAIVFAALIEHTVDVPVESDPAHAGFRFQADSAASLRMWFARAAFDGRAGYMPAQVADQWMRLVKQEMSSFRPLLGQEDNAPEGWKERVSAYLAAENPRAFACTESEERDRMLLKERPRVADLCGEVTLLPPSQRFKRDRDYFLACADQVFQFQGLWEGMRQLLLAMRALKSPCVASDLRYWEEAGVVAAHDPRQPEEPWRCIPAKLVANFHAFIGKEEAKDPELKELRSQFATFCLNGLRDAWSEKERAEAQAGRRRRTNDDMVEPSPDWRYCRVRAAKTLAINPDGRGHRLLQTASEIDPDPRVREVANDAYQSLRRGVTLPEGMSPRRAVLGAFWWLRQAHLKALNFEIDRDGAQRTRIKELSRTKERQTN